MRANRSLISCTTDADVMPSDASSCGGFTITGKVEIAGPVHRAAIQGRELRRANAVKAQNLLRQALVARGDAAPPDSIPCIEDRAG